MKSSILFMVKHENTIFDAYRRNEEKPSATWKILKNEFPELSQTRTFNTFKQYVSVFSAIRRELDKARQKAEIEQSKKIQNDKRKLMTELDNARKGLDKVRQKNIVMNLEKSKPEINPKNVMGWNVQQSKDGYYRCYRKINKQVHSIYIGKEFNLEKIRIRIREKENEINQCMTK